MVNIMEVEVSNDEGYEVVDEGLEDEDGRREVLVIRLYRDVMKVREQFIQYVFFLKVILFEKNGMVIQYLIVVFRFFVMREMKKELKYFWFCDLFIVLIWVFMIES